MGTWIASFRMIERGPAAKKAAAQIASVITITRSALIHSAPEWRQELLMELASREGIRIYSHEVTDKMEPLPEGEFFAKLHHALKENLGEETKISSKVNDIEGLWISFKIEGDEYWIVLNRTRWEHTSGLQWIGWAAAVLVLSLLGAGFISRFINQPLAKLAAAARTLASGQTPEPLSEKGIAEVKEANHNFNQMVKDLANIEAERAEILAGISHDLRTPMTRMRLEIEMANLSEAAKEGIQSDIQQMDAIVGQFLDYARLGKTTPAELVNISDALESVLEENIRKPDVFIQCQIEKNIFVQANETDLRRVLTNLVANAMLHGKTGSTGKPEIKVSCYRHNPNSVIIQIADRGPGIPAENREKMLRPFTRIDDARGQAGGSGLGLAIVERIIKRYSGKIQLKDHDGGGLLVELTIPLVS